MLRAVGEPLSVAEAELAAPARTRREGGSSERRRAARPDSLVFVKQALERGRPVLIGGSAGIVSEADADRFLFLAAVWVNPAAGAVG